VLKTPSLSTTEKGPVRPVELLLRWVRLAVCPEYVSLEDVVDALSLLVTQCRTNTENKISALQHIKQIHAASPLRTMSTVKLTTDEVSVAREPTKERSVIVRRTEFGEFL